MDPTENAEALLSISKVASDVATVIKSDFEALENTEGVPKALVNRLKRSVEASELASREISETAAKVGGSGFAYSQSRLDAEDRTVQRRLSMASGPKTPKAEKKALGDLTNFVTSYQKGESLSKKTKRDAVRPKRLKKQALRPESVIPPPADPVLGYDSQECVSIVASGVKVSPNQRARIRPVFF